MRAVFSIAILLASSPAFAQRLDVTLLTSYTTSGQIDRTAANVRDLTISDGLSWGGQATYFVFANLGVEALWTYQSTALRLSAATGSGRLFSMTMNQLYGNVVYQFRNADAAATPFVFGGLGATRFFDGSTSTTETKFAWTTGGGVKWVLGPHLAVKAQARFAPTVLNARSSDVCDPFGFCQDLLSRFEIAGGPVFRF